MMYNQLFEPAVRIGDYFGVLMASGVWRYLTCEFVEGLPPSLDLVYDGGSISSNSIARSNEITVLKMEGNSKVESDLSEVAQLRMYPIDDVAVTVKQPSASGRFKTKNTEVRVDYRTRQIDPSLKTTEIFVYEDSTIWADIYNNTNYTLSKSRIQFFGWRIVGSLLTEKPDRLTYLTAGGWQK